MDLAFAESLGVDVLRRITLPNIANPAMTPTASSAQDFLVTPKYLLSANSRDFDQGTLYQRHPKPNKDYDAVRKDGNASRPDGEVRPNSREQRRKTSPIAVLLTVNNLKGESQQKSVLYPALVLFYCLLAYRDGR
jgi:hypothetical protein